MYVETSGFYCTKISFVALLSFASGPAQQVGCGRLSPEGCPGGNEALGLKRFSHLWLESIRALCRKDPSNSLGIPFLDLGLYFFLLFLKCTQLEHFKEFRGLFDGLLNPALHCLSVHFGVGFFISQRHLFIFGRD